MCQDFVVTLRVSDFKEQVVSYMEKKCGFSLWVGGRNVDNTRENLNESNQKELRKKQKMIMQMWLRIFARQQMHVAFHPFGKEAITKDGLLFSGRMISCKIMQLTNVQNIVGGWIYLVSAPDAQEEESFSLSEQYYVKAWQVSILDAVRDWLKVYLEGRIRKEGRMEAVSNTIGPGLYGMEVESIPILYQEFAQQPSAVTLTENGMLLPACSVVGLVLRGNEEFRFPKGDCAHCLAVDGICEWCQYNGVF